jgi:hypothetical protein
MDILRNLINLIESTRDPRLVELVRDWSEGYSKDDAFLSNPSAQALEDRIIALARENPTRYHGTLYRGTGIGDEEFLALEMGRSISFRSSPARKIASWTKDPYTADRFARDAWNDGESSCAIVIAMPSDQLDVLADVDDLIGSTGEHEILVINQSLRLDHNNVIRLYRHDDL